MRKEMQHTYRLGVVSYLNAKPLIAGIDQATGLQLIFDVPAHLAPMLDAGTVDCALVPVIDVVQPQRKWQIISDACIGCDGETLTVRVFSRVPAAQIRRLHIDGDSRTSVALASIIWRELHGTKLDLEPYTGEETLDECEAVLLIGDKVVHNTLIDYEIETDLGSAWKSLTGLPFVFAVWAAPREFNGSHLAPILSQARDRGVESAKLIAADFGPALNWPVSLAERYLTKRLQFKLTDRHYQAMRMFVDLCKRHGVVDAGQELVFA